MLISNLIFAKFSFLKVSRTEKGVISDHKKPLMGSLQQSVSITSLKRF